MRSTIAISTSYETSAGDDKADAAYHVFYREYEEKNIIQEINFVLENPTMQNFDGDFSTILKN